MIKKAVLLTLLAPFLMVFSDFALAYTWKYTGSSPKTRDQAVRHIANNYSNIVTKIRQDSPQAGGRFAIFRLAPGKTIEDIPQSDFLNEQIFGLPYTDEQCSQFSGDSVSISPSSANYLSNGGSVSQAGGACSVSSPGGVVACSGDPVECVIPLIAQSTGEIAMASATDSDIDLLAGDGTFSVLDFSGNDYLTELPGGCTDNASCVPIGDKTYLVDWDSAPDHFEYVPVAVLVVILVVILVALILPTQQTLPTPPTQAVTVAAILVVIPVAAMAATIPAMVPAVPRVAVVALVAALPYRILSLTNPALLRLSAPLANPTATLSMPFLMMSLVQLTIRPMS